MRNDGRIELEETFAARRRRKTRGITEDGAMQAVEARIERRAIERIGRHREVEHRVLAITAWSQVAFNGSLTQGHAESFVRTEHERIGFLRARDVGTVIREAKCS